MSIATASQRNSGYSASQTLIRFIPSPSLMRRGERSDQAQGSSSNAGLAPIGAKKKGKGVRAETQRCRRNPRARAKRQNPFLLRVSAPFASFFSFFSFFSFLPSPARGR